MKIIQYVSSLPWFFLSFDCWAVKRTARDYLNPELDVDQRVDDLIARMTIHEKISQMSHLAPGIERLGIVPYEPNFENPLMFDDHPDYDTDLFIMGNNQSDVRRALVFFLNQVDLFKHTIIDGVAVIGKLINSTFDHQRKG